jgi:hypothetical protein
MAVCEAVSAMIQIAVGAPCLTGSFSVLEDERRFENTFC